ncbi:MAG: NAD(P)H-hydrate dehydratase [Rhodobacteraceae bacterium]|nr:NAD(P)H-hydrate dehydratase [Defluviimonas sp.]MCP5377104.1 NAD(P)H-hydrate dehydratase [Paracoccaceae bacterium]
MTELLTAAQMRAIEQAAIASGEVTGLELMERAGRGVVEAIFEEWPELAKTSHRAVVLCGPGNNGGDGFVVARLLKEWGWEVEVFLYGDPEKMPPDARVNYERWLGMGEVQDADRLEGDYGVEDVLRGKPDLFVDALFGTGLSRAIEVTAQGDAARGEDPDETYYNALHSWMSLRDYDYRFDQPMRIVAIDIPSGLCADSGRVLGGTFKVDLCVCFHLPKAGLHLSQGPECAARIRLVDIGLPKDQQIATGGRPVLSFPVDAENRRWLTEKHDAVLASKKSVGHNKYTHGHALILSGGAGRGGAARLAARGAIRIGAGVVTVGCPPDAIPENAGRLDAVMLRPIADADVLARVLEDGRINALCLGPGMGTGAREVGLMEVALGLADQWAAPDPTGGGAGTARRAAGRSLVLDADALTLLSQDPDLFAALHDGCVLTPHGGEFARLFPDIAEKLAAPATKGPAYSKVDATREAAARAGCVVLFKGPDTVIADPSGRCSINSAHYDRAAPWLATAGSGDVLAGFIAGLLARGFAPMQAAETAAWLHVECARKFGPGLIAEDLPEQLPAVFRDLGL